MSRKRQSRWRTIVLLVLIAALLATVGVIVYKEYQYKESESYYDSLR